MRAITVLLVLFLVVILGGCISIPRDIDENPDYINKVQELKDLNNRIKILEGQIASKTTTCKVCPVCKAIDCPKQIPCPVINCDISESNLLYKAKLMWERAKSEQNNAEDEIEEFRDLYDDENHEDCPEVNDNAREYLFDANAFYQKAKHDFENIPDSESAEYYAKAMDYMLSANEDLSDWLSNYRESCRRGDFDYLDENDDEYEDYEKYMTNYDKMLTKIELVEKIT